MITFSKPDEPVYEEQDFIALENLIRGSAAYQAVQNQPRLVTALLRRLQSNLVKRP